LPAGARQLHAGEGEEASADAYPVSGQRRHELKNQTGGEAFGFRHQLTTERQCLFAFRAIKRGSAFLPERNGMSFWILFSHRFLRLCCTEGVSTEGIELF
jgi:hypothetical protein